MSSTKRIFRSLLALPLLISGSTESAEPPAASYWAARVPDDGGSAPLSHPSGSPPRLHVGCQLFLNETHEAQPKLVGREYAERHGPSSYSPAREKGSTSAECKNGMAAGYPCKGISLYSMLDLTELSRSLGTPWRDNNANDIWGWADQESGREFAIICLQRGTAFVEITDPYNPVYKGALKTRGNENDSGNFWRDVKTYRQFALIVSEIDGHGMQVFNLKRLLSDETDIAFTETAHYDGFGYAHNIFVNEDTGYAYAVGTSTCSGGLHFVNLRKPHLPTFAQCYSSDGYTHDVQCVRYDGPHRKYLGREICFASNQNTITIVDVSDKANPQTITKFTYDNGSGRKYTHQGWLTEDHKYFIFDDEADERASSLNTQTFVVNVMTLTQPVIAGTHFGRTRAVDHNLYIKKDLVYQANYRAGLNVLQIRDITRAEFDEVAYFDVYPQDDSPSFNGVWSNYPFFPSGVVIISGIEQGLFMLDMGELSPKQTPSPSYISSSEPTDIPSPGPSSSVRPSDVTSQIPSSIPTITPRPTKLVSSQPSINPSLKISDHPSRSHSKSPSFSPSNFPSILTFIRQIPAIDSCPTGYNPIYDVLTCEKASTVLGITNEPSQNGDDYPINTVVCFVSFVNLSTGEITSSSRSQVNSNHFAQAAWICKSAATESPTPEPTAWRPTPKPTTVERLCVGNARRKNKFQKKKLRKILVERIKICRKLPNDAIKKCQATERKKNKRQIQTITKVLKTSLRTCRRKFF